jgi:CheY-like chemotaxis protein
VLVVDDDPAASDLLDSQLSSAGYTVTVCNQPLNAVQMAVELQTDVITLDIIMPPANGWELLANLKSDPRTASIPVIVCTVLDQRETAAMLAADEYVAKPVDRAILLAAVERSLSRPRTHETDDVVLVVEDDDAAREMIAEMLTGSGYRVETAANGELARSRVAASLPQLVILDIILPGVSGLELIAEWHKQPRTENLPILVLTSKDLTPKEKEYLHANTITFLSKHEKWTDKLLQQIRKAAPLALTENA